MVDASLHSRSNRDRSPAAAPQFATEQTKCEMLYYTSKKYPKSELFRKAMNPANDHLIMAIVAKVSKEAASESRRSCRACQGKLYAPYNRYSGQGIARHLVQ